MKRLLPMGTILQIPQAGLAVTDEKIKSKPGEVLQVLKASIEGLEYALAEHEDKSDIISKWIALNAAQGVKAYDSVKTLFRATAFPLRSKAKPTLPLRPASIRRFQPNRSSIFLPPPQRQKNWRAKNERNDSANNLRHDLLQTIEPNTTFSAEVVDVSRPLIFIRRDYADNRPRMTAAQRAQTDRAILDINPV